MDIENARADTICTRILYVRPAAHVFNRCKSGVRLVVGRT